MTCLQCYDCKGRDCSITTATVKTCANADDMCHSLTTYVRNDATLPVNDTKQITMSTLKCLPKAEQGTCSTEDANFGKNCLGTPENAIFNLDCMYCCSKDKCNDKVANADTNQDKEDTSSSIMSQASKFVLLINMISFFLVIFN